MNIGRDRNVENEEVYLLALNIFDGSKMYLNNWLNKLTNHTHFPHYFLPTAEWPSPNMHGEGWVFTLVPSRYIAKGRLLERNDPNLPHPGHVLWAFSKAVPVDITVKQARQLSKVIEFDALTSLMALMWGDGVPHIERTSLMADQVMEPVLHFLSNEWEVKVHSSTEFTPLVVAE